MYFFFKCIVFLLLFIFRITNRKYDAVIVMSTSLTVKTDTYTLSCHVIPFSRHNTVQ